MPYEELNDLPDSVKRNLPTHAREIYRAAHNSAEEHYDEESRVPRVAWNGTVAGLRSISDRSGVRG